MGGYRIIYHIQTLCQTYLAVTYEELKDKFEIELLFHKQQVVNVLVCDVLHLKISLVND